MQYIRYAIVVCFTLLHMHSEKYILKGSHTNKPNVRTKGNVHDNYITTLLKYNYFDFFALFFFALEVKIS